MALPPGTYSLKAELAGFKTSVIDQIQLTVDTAQRIDVALSVGGVEESVQVLAEAPAINTTDASLGNVIKEAQIMNLPLEARNPVGLLSLQTGVVYIPRSNPDTVDPRYGAVSGARADQSNVTLDGIDVNDGQNQSAFTSVLRLTLDSVQEFRVTTSSYGADGGPYGSTHDGLARWWRHEIVIEPFLGSGAYGDRFAPPFTALAAIDDKTRQVVNSDGVEVVSQTTVVFPRPVGFIPPGSKAT